MKIFQVVGFFLVTVVCTLALCFPEDGLSEARGVDTFAAGAATEERSIKPCSNAPMALPFSTCSTAEGLEEQSQESATGQSSERSPCASAGCGAKEEPTPPSVQELAALVRQGDPRATKELGEMLLASKADLAASQTPELRDAFAFARQALYQAAQSGNNATADAFRMRLETQAN